MMRNGMPGRIGTRALVLLAAFAAACTVSGDGLLDPGAGGSGGSTGGGAGGHQGAGQGGNQGGSTGGGAGGHQGAGQGGNQGGAGGSTGGSGGAQGGAGGHQGAGQGGNQGGAGGNGGATAGGNGGNAGIAPDAGAPDAPLVRPDGAAPIDGGGPIGKPTPGEVACGNASCNLEKNQYCCVGQQQSQCLDDDQRCNANSRRCDDPSDCGDGDVCCYDPDGAGDWELRCRAADDCSGSGRTALCLQAEDCKAASGSQPLQCCPGSIGGQSVGLCRPLCPQPIGLE